MYLKIENKVFLGNFFFVFYYFFKIILKIII